MQSKQPLRIIHLIDKSYPPSADDGGVPQFVATLQQAQEGQGHEPGVATTGALNDPNGFKLKANTGLAEQFCKVLQSTAVDIVHFHAFDHLLQPVLKKLGIPSICHMHGDHYGSEVRSQNRVYVSRAHAARHRAAEYVHNGVNIDAYPFEATSEDYLVFLGKVRRSKKGVDIAVDIAKKNRRLLRIIGGRKLSVPETWVPLSRYVRAEGVLRGDEKCAVLSKAAALLFPIRWEEPFGLVLIEAMACGVPVVAFNRGAVREIVRHGETGFVVEDVDGMNAALGRLGEIDRTKCRLHVERNFPIERTAHDIEQYYRRAIAGEKW